MDYYKNKSLGGGYSDIFIHTKARDIFGGFNIFNFNIFLGFHKNEYFLRHEDFLDIILVSSHNWIIFRVIYMHFMVFF